MRPEIADDPPGRPWVSLDAVFRNTTDTLDSARLGDLSDEGLLTAMESGTPDDWRAVSRLIVTVQDGDRIVRLARRLDGQGAANWWTRRALTRTGRPPEGAIRVPLRPSPASDSGSEPSSGGMQSWTGTSELAALLLGDGSVRDRTG